VCHPLANCCCSGTNLHTLHGEKAEELMLRARRAPAMEIEEYCTICMHAAATLCPSAERARERGWEIFSSMRALYAAGAAADA